MNPTVGEPWRECYGDGARCECEGWAEPAPERDGWRLLGMMNGGVKPGE
jgi:hypothetical protein